MLQAYQTKNGTGISIFGDFGDLNLLYETVHLIADALDEDNKMQAGQYQLLMNFAYEIRHAYSGQRLTNKFQYPGEKQKIDHYGFNVVWTDIILFITTLRANLEFAQTDKAHQASLYMLEFVFETALSEYDKAGAKKILQFLQKGINIRNENLLILYQSMHIEFVMDKPGKPRFNRIPILIKAHFVQGSVDYNEIINSFEEIANRENCEVSDLEFTEFPDITW